MQSAGHRLVAVLVAIGLLVHPVAATPKAPELRVPGSGDRASAVVSIRRQLVALGATEGAACAAAARLTEDDLAVFAAHPAMLQRAGNAPLPAGGLSTPLVEDLVALGHAPEQALAMVGQLTPEDLYVLVHHPAMLQRAGVVSHEVWAYVFIGVLIALIVLAVASNNSSGFVSVN